MGPESVEVGPQRLKAGRVHGVDPTRAVRAIRYKTSILEHPQVLRDGGTADWEVASQLTDCTWADYQALEDGATGAIA
jgi:hypothetical protein